MFSYYSLEDVSHESINKYLSNLVEKGLRELECSYCIEIKEVRACSARKVTQISFTWEEVQCFHYFSRTIGPSSR